jgi:ATP-dependent DNA helicase RecG
MPSQYKGISKSAKGLLASGESKFVDYKEKVKGFHAEDLVAFANSNEGGAILIGVREATTSTGVQIGEPIGHPVDDDT